MSSAERVVRLAGWLLRADQREEWLEEWLAELRALNRAHADGVEGLPSAMSFALGAIPHGVWTRTEGWTVDRLFQDLKYAFRGFRRSPGFAFVAILTLALGIGANGAIFSLVNGLVLRDPAGVHQPDRLVQVARSYASAPRWDTFSWPALKLIAEEDGAFDGVAGHRGQTFILGRGQEVERVSGSAVTGNYFEVLGVPPMLGRLLQPADEAGDIDPVVVLSHALWQSRYGADPALIGQTIPIGARPHVVVGVAPPDFVGVVSVGARPELWVPATPVHLSMLSEGRQESWGFSWIDGFARLRDGVTLEGARAAMESVSAQLQAATPNNGDMIVELEAGLGLDPQSRRAAQATSVVLLVIVGLVLLITCTNVANLFLARATARRGEVAVRQALGASRRRLLRQMITESSVLALLATVLAVPLVALSGRLLPSLLPYNVAFSLSPDIGVYIALAATGLVAGLLFGAAPAWSSARGDAAQALRDSKATVDRSRTRLRDVLVVAQLALSLGLVSGTALLGRSVANASAADAGFDAAGVLAGRLDLDLTGRYDDATGYAFMRQLLDRARQEPGVRAATIASQVPLAGGHARASVRRPENPDDFFEAEYTVVGPGYFETMGIPIVRGRALGGFDEEPEPVVVVNERLAELFWPGEDAIGQMLERGGQEWRVVGVSADVRMRSLRAAPNPAVYYPIDHAYDSWMVLHIAGAGDRTPPTAALASIVGSIDPELPMLAVYDLGRVHVESMGETRTIGALVGAFALLALMLAAVGLYGLISFAASQRVRELGIRAALGARPSSLMTLVVGRGVVLSLLGVGLGVLVSIGLGGALEGLLFGVAPSSVPVLLVSALVMLAAAAVASGIPAWKAGRVDAASSLRGS